MTNTMTDKFKDTLKISSETNVGLNIAMPENSSILIATPMYGGMCTGHYTIAIMNSIDTLKKLKVEKNRKKQKN